MSKQIQLWTNIAKKAGNGDLVDAFVKASEQFYITDDVPDAEERLSDLQEKAQDLRNLLDAVKVCADSLQREIDSLTGVDVTKKEE